MQTETRTDASDGNSALPYRRVARMVLADLLALRESPHRRALRGRTDVYQIDRIVERVEPVMANHPDMVVEEAIKLFGGPAPGRPAV